jgi:isoleucyl-tRNA synthetase
VSKALEISRREKVIGHSLDSIVKLELPDKFQNIVKSFAEELRFIFIVSKVELVDSLSTEDNVYESDSLPGVKVYSKMHPGEKCERCWNYFDPDTQGSKTNGEICLRCEVHLQVTGA